ncbi:MAG: oligopeptidase A [Gammaproteobacteria bacterium]|nr:MAG: oligopeptidase A [Gammaproteobacteria bacterium]
MTNPLLETTDLPQFSKINPADIQPAIEGIIESNKSNLDQLLQSTKQFTWNNFIAKIEKDEDKLSKAWSPVGHMNSVVNTSELRDAYNACLPILSKYATEFGQNESVYRAYKQIADSAEFKELDEGQQKTIEYALRDFHLSGVDLPSAKKEAFKEIKQELSSLSAKFEQNLLDATNSWNKNFADESALKGLPEFSIAMAKQAAAEREQEGYTITLEFPSYFAVITYADNRELRHEAYEAFCTRASDQGPDAGKWDNTEVIYNTLEKRLEAAKILGFNNHAEKSLATKMAENPQQVINFLNDLANHSTAKAKAEYAELEQFAQEEFGINTLEAWDVSYASEKLRQKKYAISQEDLRPYFPAPKVIQGLFTTVEKLFPIKIEQISDFDSWHKDVSFYQINDLSDNQIGRFYFDLYARQNKRGGAWMDECKKRFVSNSINQTPVAYLTCNFAPPVGDKPSLLTHNDVTTLFHEFGHGLHHMLTVIDHPSVSGINGVPWDAVELPSQFLENWCWNKETLDMISGHYESDEKLPNELFDKMLKAKNFQAAMQMVRQIEFALFDMRLHTEFTSDSTTQVEDILREVREQVAVMIPPAFNRFANSFSHIFAGGYSAGYYSYKWAEVLSADAFSKFEENGIFNQKTGEQFLTTFLQNGGSRDAMQMFIDFRGREPKIDALLRHSGLA